MIGNTVSLSGGGGKLKAEKAALNLTTKVDSNYKPYNPEEPIGFITMSTNRPEDAEEDQGSISLMNCDTNIKVFTDLQNVVFQQGIRAAGTLTVDGGTLKMNSDDGKPEYSGGSFGVQGNDVILKNNAKADIQLNGNNLVFGLIADNKLDISNASANVVIDNSEGRFDLKEEKAEVLGIGAMTMDIGVADSTNKVSSKIINYDN
ncbi:MAG: hypothetical protein RR614_02510, partial [Eubacterium sp.]